MAKDPAFLFYPGDYLRDTQCLSEKCQVAYDRIMCEHMRNTCISHTQLKFFVKRLSEAEIEELKSILVETDAGFHIPWVVDSIDKRRAYSESRRNNRKGKTKKRGKKDVLSHVEHMENEIVNEDIVVIVNYLNAKAEKKYQAKSQKTREKIKARLNDGFSVEDFKTVVDQKVSQWLGDAKWEKFLRPETLFGPKFEGYLNEAPAEESNGFGGYTN